MTVSSPTARAMHVTNSAVTDYAYNFKIFNAAQLQVTVVDAATSGRADLILASDYGVSGVGNESGGSVSLTASGRTKAGDGNSLVILRSMPFVQETDFQIHGKMPAEMVERALDIAAMERQQILEKLGRAVIQDPSKEETIPYQELAAALEQAGANVAAAKEAAGLATTKAEESKQAATEAKTARTQSQTAQGKAEAAAGAAVQAAETVETSKGEVLTAAGQAKVVAERAESAANSADKSKTAAGASAESATQSADRAEKAAGEAGADADRAEDAAARAAAAAGVAEGDIPLPARDQAVKDGVNTTDFLTPKTAKDNYIQRGEAFDIHNYNHVDDIVDADRYFSQIETLLITNANSLNFPVTTRPLFFKVETDENKIIVTQWAWGQSTDLFVRTGVVDRTDEENPVGTWTYWIAIGAGVKSVNGRAGAVTLTKADVGLDNVDNTADVNKPLSTPQQTALNTALDNEVTRQYGACATTAATAAKVGTVSGFVRRTGAIVGLKFTYANTAANPALNVNGTGAAAIRYKNAAITADMIPAGHVALFQFDGSYWQLLNPAGGGAPLPQTATGVGQWVELSTEADLNSTVLPSGGTWAYFLFATQGMDTNAQHVTPAGTRAGIVAGGSAVGTGSAVGRRHGFAWRIS